MSTNTNLFISHFKNTNQIDSLYGNVSIIYILILLILLILITVKKKQPAENITQKGKEEFDHQTAKTLRGLAVIFLILGHLSIKCIEGISLIEYAGSWAVIIFLFISGFGLTKTYHLQKLKTVFLLKRLRRLLFPFWLSLTLFIVLDYFLLNSIYSIQRIILTFMGITFPWPPNGPAWFITYIVFLYSLFFIVSQLKWQVFYKALTILLSSYVVMFVLLQSEQLLNYFGIWIQYTIVFPSAVIIGLYSKKIFEFIDSFQNMLKISFILTLLLLFVLYAYKLSHIEHSTIVPTLFQSLKPLILLICLLMVAHLFDSSNYQSRALLFLGDYSYEIYLLHLPFMEDYDFILFRRPMFLSFLVYGLAIVTLSWFLKKASDVLNRRFFSF